MKSPTQILDMMLNKDQFSKEMEMKVLFIDFGSCTICTTVTKKLLNGFEIAHGAVTYALADSALAFASNSRGFQCVSIETSISHLKKVVENDTLTAKCSEIHRGKKLGLYQVEVMNQNKELVAFFKGTVSISDKIW